MDDKPRATAGRSLLEQLRTVALAAATAALLFLCWLIARPFLSVITWAVALAVVAHPWHKWLEHRMRPNLAALLSVVSVALLLVVPGVWIGQNLFQEASSGFEVLGPELQSDRMHSRLQQYPTLAAITAWLETTLNLDQEIRRATGAIASKASALVGSSLWLLTQLFLTFLTLFYFFRDQKRLLSLLRELIPLSDEQTRQLFDRVSHTIHACVYGNVIVKLAQGLLGGLMFWFLGLPAPVLCGAATALFAVLPVLGTALVWGPAAVLLALSGSWGKALILVLWGMLVVGLIDNVLYPILVAGELRLHTLAVFFSILGGLIAFGLAGVILGPVILAVTGALLEVWRLRTMYGPSPPEEISLRKSLDRTAERSL